MRPTDRVGFIGLGNMGGSISLRILRAGFPMTVLDLDKEKLSPLVNEGAETARTPKEVAERSTVVFASLQAKAMEEVASGKNGLHESKTKELIFVDLSSTPIDMAIKVSSELRGKGIEMLDAPVSGADIGAVTGKLTVFVGGEYRAYQRALPVLQHVGHRVTYLGKNGNGQIGKRINQMMQATSELALYEGLLLADKMGLDPKMFAYAAAGGCAQSWRLDELVENVFQRGENQYKLRLRPGRTGNAIKMAKEAGLTLQGVETVHRVFSEQDWNVVLDLNGKKAE